MVSCITRLRYMLSTRLHMSTCSSRSDFSSLAASRRKTLEELVMKTCKEKEIVGEMRLDDKRLFYINDLCKVWTHSLSVTNLDLEPLVTCTPTPGLTCSVAWTPAWTLYSKTSESEDLFPELLHQLGFWLWTDTVSPISCTNKITIDWWTITEQYYSYIFLLCLTTIWMFNIKNVCCFACLYI